MAYTKITRTAYGREALAYALNGKGHDGSGQRNLYVGGVNMMPPNVASYAEQMNRYWVRADGKNKTQVNRIIASFSPGELNPDDPESPLRAAQICDAFVREYYPGRQAVVCIQNDGEGHKLHAHMLVSNVSMCEVKLPGEKRAQKPYAGCRGYQLKFDYVKDNFNRVAEQYITLDQGKTAADKVSQYERRMRQHNKQLAPGEQAKYIWKDDLKERVKKAMSEASDRGDFLRKLTENGVEGSFHETKKGRRYYTYELTDISGFGGEKVPQNLKARSYKLGTDYDYETIQAMLPDEPSPMPKAAGIQDAPQAPSAPHTGHQDVLVQEHTPTFGKRQNKPSGVATQGMQAPQASSAPHTGHQDVLVQEHTPTFGKRQNKPSGAATQGMPTAKAAPDIPETTPGKVQVTPPPPDLRQEKAERQRKEKERMEAENRRRQEMLRRQMENDSKKAAAKQPRNIYDTPGFQAAMRAAASLAEKWEQEEAEKDDYGYRPW